MIPTHNVPFFKRFTASDIRRGQVFCGLISYSQPVRYSENLTLFKGKGYVNDMPVLKCLDTNKHRWVLVKHPFPTIAAAGRRSALVHLELAGYLAVNTPNLRASPTRVLTYNHEQLQKLLQKFVRARSIGRKAIIHGEMDKLRATLKRWCEDFNQTMPLLTEQEVQILRGWNIACLLDDDPLGHYRVFAHYHYPELKV